jgi:hypothetical protein
MGFGPLNCGECVASVGHCIGVCRRQVRDPRPEPPPAGYEAPSLSVRGGGDPGSRFDEAGARREARRREADELTALLAHLKALRERVPAAYQRWDYERTVAFKAACQKAGTTLKAARPSKDNVLRQIKELEDFARG